MSQASVDRVTTSEIGRRKFIAGLGTGAIAAGMSPLAAHAADGEAGTITGCAAIAHARNVARRSQQRGYENLQFTLAIPDQIAGPLSLGGSYSFADRVVGLDLRFDRETIDFLLEQARRFGRPGRYQLRIPHPEATVNFEIAEDVPRQVYRLRSQDTLTDGQFEVVITAVPETAPSRVTLTSFSDARLAVPWHVIIAGGTIILYVALCFFTVWVCASRCNSLGRVTWHWLRGCQCECLA